MAADQPDAFVDAAQPESRAAAFVHDEPDTVVHDAELDLGWGPQQLDERGTGLRVTNHIRQRLLGHAVETEGDLGRDRVEVVAGLERHGNAVQARDLGAVLPQRRDESGVLQHRRVKLAGEVPD